MTTATINDELADAQISTTVRVAQVEKQTNLEVRGRLWQLERELAGIVIAAGFDDVLPRFQESRLQRTTADVSDAVDAAYRDAARMLQTELDGIAVQTQRLTVESSNRIVDAPWLTSTLTMGALREISRNPTVLGSSVRENWNVQRASLKRDYATNMRLGMSRGEDTQTLVSRVIGERTGSKERVVVEGKTRSVAARTGGMMATAKNKAKAVVSTASQTIVNAVFDLFRRKNKLAYEGLTLLVTLDNRTTPICISLDGGRWTMEGKPTRDSAVEMDYPGPPPYHMQCRTIPASIAVAWADLPRRDQRVIERNAKNPDDVRARMDGKPPKRTRARAWLERQTVEEQNAILGKKRADMFRAGKLDLQQLTDPTLRPRTLAELESLFG